LLHTRAIMGVKRRTEPAVTAKPAAVAAACKPLAPPDAPAAAPAPTSSADETATPAEHFTPPRCSPRRPPRRRSCRRVVARRVSPYPPLAGRATRHELLRPDPSGGADCNLGATEANMFFPSCACCFSSVYAPTHSGIHGSSDGRHGASGSEVAAAASCDPGSRSPSEKKIQKVGLGRGRG
jgi:hypothetical protein